MLQYFRKYQKSVFIVITVVIGISFVFFGTYSSIPKPEKKKDKVLYKALNNTVVMESLVENMAGFLSSSSLDSSEHPSRRNLLNDGVIEKDILGSKLGEEITAQYFKEVEADLEATWKKGKAFRTYVHPRAPFLSAEVIWENYFPDLAAHLKNFRKEEWGSKSYSMLADLYIDQVRFPQDLLRRVLMYQEQQFSWIGEDPDLQTRNLNLFGLRSLEEWFGKQWVQLVSQVIINAASEASSKGYVVSNDEAEASLIQNVYEALKQLDPQRTYSYSDAYGYLQNQSRVMGLETKETIALWQKVLLFRRLFDDAGMTVFVDPLSYKNFAHYAKEKVSADLYHLPSEFCFNDFRSVVKGQIYFDIIRKSPSTGGVLEVPTQICDPLQLEKSYPEFVQRSFTLEFSKADKKQLAGKVALKDLWNWQMQEGNWAAIVKEFPEIAHHSVEKQDRFDFLEGLEKTLRSKIDAFSVQEMIPTDAVFESLAKSSPQTQTIFIRSRGGELPFEGISSQEELLALLEKAPVKGQENILDEEKIAQEKLEFFTQDGVHFYHIAVIEKGQQKEIVPLKEVALDGTLDEILDKKLEEQYQSLLKKGHPSLVKSDGQKKSFSEARHELAPIAYAPLVQALKNEYLLVSKDQGDQPADFYAKYRFSSYLDMIKKDLEKNGHSDLISLQDEQGGIEWKVRKVVKEVERSKKNPWIDEKIFSMDKQTWSNIHLIDEGTIGFFQVGEKLHSDDDVVKKLDEEQILLGLEAKKQLMSHLLKKIEEKKAITFMSRE